MTSTGIQGDSFLGGGGGERERSPSPSVRARPLKNHPGYLRTQYRTLACDRSLRSSNAFALDAGA